MSKTAQIIISDQEHTVSNQPFIGRLFGTDRKALSIICIGVILWLLLAILTAHWIFDPNASLVDNSKNYLQHVIKNGKIYLIFVFIMYLVKLVKATNQTHKGQSALKVWVQDLKIERLKNNVNIIGMPVYFVFSLILFAVYLFSYSTIKTRIPNIFPYHWDVTFQSWDRIIFLGRDPWEWFSFLYDMPIVIRALDFIYDMWAPVLVTCWFFALRYGGKNKQRRFQFVIALLLTWFIGGNLLAILGSSVGPIYFENLTGLSSSYGRQMEILSEINAVTPLRSFEYQALLWNIYQSPSVGLGGISAMPSMHCASSFLLFIMYGTNKMARIALGAFCFIIFVSSFVLAWHYAVDGIIALPIAVLCWKIAGRLLEKNG